ncbi:hypothetical protein SAY86_024645 [Trapa natans]|uniref:Uncharacterized protein n=1 Tax=Trapa natans TaxID=22666 RepID=A0AAN7REI0_TRANT|nr:hypothetical protein SAY86_024645 [Trapa natans]
MEDLPKVRRETEAGGEGPIHWKDLWFIPQRRKPVAQILRSTGVGVFTVIPRRPLPIHASTSGMLIVHLLSLPGSYHPYPHPSSIE